MINIIGSNNIDRDAWVCVCLSPGCQDNDDYMNGYADGMADGQADD